MDNVKSLKGTVTLFLENRLERGNSEHENRSVSRLHFSRQDNGGLNQHGFVEVRKRERDASRMILSFLVLITR